MLMPSQLSASSISRAVDHLCKYGDTDVFPHLIEIVFLRDKKTEVIQELAALDLDTFNPAQAIETISPKSRYGFRIVHQLLCLETLLFTAAAIEIGNDLEQSKRPVTEEFGPFSYRFSDGEDASIFLEGHTYRDWLNWQATTIHGGEYDYVICTDIADFYQRIYLHRIENCLDTATTNKGIKRFIEKLIKNVRSKQSHGIPVGGTASRLKNRETLDNRQLYLIRGIKADVNFFRRQKARFDEKNNFEKYAFMIGATCLPRDEFETWVSVVKPNMARPLDRLFCDWVRTKAGKLDQILQTRIDLTKD